MARKRRRKARGHPGFPFACRRKGWTFAQWEKKVKAVKRSRAGYNPYAVVNSYCKIHGPGKSRRRYH